jgi:UDP-N-acetylglucosamine--N-acetylmuramyl-(pentapeptide) pyrophosphoryl-undecaprenol N-acetylglucosamine transferase
LQIADCRLGSDAGLNLQSSIFNLQFVGSEDGMEAGIVRRESALPFLAVPAAAIRGRGPLALARNTATLARGTLAARRLIARERPAAILGTGGYVCVPVFLAARAMRVPTAIYLPDVVPGLAVRFLSRLATVTACSVEDSAPYFGFSILDFGSRSGQSKIGYPAGVNPKSKMVVTGYPVRPELFRLDRAACRAAFGLADDPPALLVTGGSRGARSINRAIAALLPHLLEIAQVIHICGREGDEAFLRGAADELPDELRARYHLYAYLHSQGTRDLGLGTRETGSDQAIPHSRAQLAPSPQPLAPDMLAALGAADLAVCRSGASTLGELPAAGLPAVLVPYPYVHQDENADYLVRHGAALKVHDDAMLGDGRPEDGPLFQQIRRLIGDANERRTMAARSRALARPDAAQRLADVLLGLAARRVPA